MNTITIGSMSNQLELPLILPTDHPRRIAPIIQLRPSWSDEDIGKLREQLLKYSLRFLADGRSSYRVKKEVYEWVMSDDIHPFSFFVCCEEGNYNPLKVRAGISFMLRRLNVSFTH